MSLRPFCDRCTQEIVDQDKGIVHFRVTTFETPLAFNSSSPNTPQQINIMIIMCRPCYDKFNIWLVRS